MTDDSSEGDEKKPSNGSAVGKDGRQREGSISTVQAVANVKEKEQQQVPLTRHDLDVKYFRKDLVLFKNLDLFRWVPNLASFGRRFEWLIFWFIPNYCRARDFSFALVLVYSTFPTFLNLFSASSSIVLALLFFNALAWRVFHSFGLGIALKRQSRDKWIVRVSYLLSLAGLRRLRDDR